MKKIILGLAVIVAFVACKSNKSETEKVHVVLVQDTSMIYNNSMLTDKSQGANATTIGAAVAGAPVTTETKNHSTSNVSRTNSANTGSGTVATNAVPAKKKGLSHKARGAIVGAGTGAITGALVNSKNRGLGAVVGAVVGAATGYVIGNEVDKKKKRP